MAGSMVDFADSVKLLPIISFIKSACVRLSRKRILGRKGQTLVEYALVMAIITVIAVGVFSEMSHHIITIFSSLNSLLDTAQASH